VTLERLILYLSPAFVLVFNVLYLRQRIRLLQWLGVLISYVGIVIVFGYETLHVDNTTETAFGLLLVFGSTLSYSCYLVMSADIVKRIGVAKLTGLASSVACIFCITHFLLTKPISALQVAPEALKLSLFNAFFCTVIPVFFIMSAIKCLGPALTAQIGMLGAISTIILGHFILGETAGQATWLGTTLVLLGIYMVTRSKKDKVIYENKQKKPKH
jgi:drug/metabolite transporter (DMT)-like permease